MTTTDTAALGTPTPSFEDVYRTHAARVYRYCLSQVSSTHDAEDLAADVFASACRAYPTAGVSVVHGPASTDQLSLDQPSSSRGSNSSSKMASIVLDARRNDRTATTSTAASTTTPIVIVRATM